MSRQTATDLLYNGAGQLEQKTESDGTVTRYTYNDTGDVTLAVRTKNGVSIQTTFVYDPQGSLVTTVTKQL